MRDSIRPTRLTGSRRTCLFALAAVVSGVPTAAARGGANRAGQRPDRGDRRRAVRLRV